MPSFLTSVKDFVGSPVQYGSVVGKSSNGSYSVAVDGRTMNVESALTGEITVGSVAIICRRNNKRYIIATTQTTQSTEQRIVVIDV